MELGSSLQVPWIQDLVKGSTTSVPERYIRREQDSPSVLDRASLPQVPVIDLNRLTTAEFKDSELQKLHYACKDWGFFQLINHGVDDKVMEGVKTGFKDFFNLPMEEKKKFWQKPGETQGFGQAFVVSEEQKLDWADIFYLTTLPTHMRRPHLLPKLPQPFRDALETYVAETKDLAVKTLHFMAKALGMDAEEVDELFEDGTQGMRMNYYPPCPQPDLVIGLNSHSDAAAITILLQVNETEGLQIKKHSQWVPIKPLPNAFIINIGDIMEIVTNGEYRSIEHRATINAEKERLSIAAFYSPKMEAEIGPAPTLITAESPALFRRITVAEHLKGYFSSELKGKAYLDSMRIQNCDAAKI